MTSIIWEIRQLRNALRMLCALTADRRNVQDDVADQVVEHAQLLLDMPTALDPDDQSQVGELPENTLLFRQRD